MKKSFYIVLFAIMLGLSSIAGAQTPQEISTVYDSTQKTVAMSAKVSDKANKLVLVHIVSEDEKDLEEPEYVIYDGYYTDNNGYIDITEYIPEDFPSGKHIVTLTVEDAEYETYFINVNYSSISALLPELNRVQNADELGQLLADNIQNLAIDESVYTSLATEINTILYSSRPADGFSDAAEYMYKYNNAVATSYIKNGADLAQIVNKYSKELGITYSDYENLTASQKELLSGYLKNYEYNDLKTAFYQNRVLACVKSASQVLELEEHFSQGISYINPDLTYFNELKIPEKVYEQLYLNLEKINTVPQLIEQFETAAKERYTAENKEASKNNGKDSGKDKGGGGFPAIGGAGKLETALNTGNQGFSDIQTHWAKEYIDKLAQDKIINGYNDSTFRPDANVTRAEFVKMVVLAFVTNAKIDSTVTFSDVSNTSWCYEYVNKAAAAGVVNGIGNGGFAPDSNITREDAAVILGRIAEQRYLINNAAQADFTDFSNISPYAVEYISALTQQNIILGFSDGAFYPKNLITRAQAATLICRLAEKLK